MVQTNAIFSYNPLINASGTTISDPIIVGGICQHNFHILGTAMIAGSAHIEGTLNGSNWVKCNSSDMIFTSGVAINNEIKLTDGFYKELRINVTHLSGTLNAYYLGGN